MPFDVLLLYVTALIRPNACIWRRDSAVYNQANCQEMSAESTAWMPACTPDDPLLQHRLRFKINISLSEKWARVWSVIFIILSRSAIVSEMTYNVLSDTLNPTIPYSASARALHGLGICIIIIIIIIITRGQSNLTKSASRGAHSQVRGHPRGSKVVPLNSWGRVSY